MQMLVLAQAALGAASAVEASSRFFAAAERIGATYLQTRLYTRPQAPLTSKTHWAAGGFVLRRAPERWPGSAGFDYVCFTHNPLLTAIREGRTRYRFSDFAPHDDRRHADYWAALSEARIAEAICTTSYGRERGIASLHLGFGQRSIDPATAAAVERAGLILTERLIDFHAPPAPRLKHPLSARQRDALAYAAEGRTDREIAELLGVSESTARFHIDSARRRLGAVNRTHAVAKLVSMGLL